MVAMVTKHANQILPPVLAVRPLYPFLNKILVTPAWEEPLPGWVDSLNGPVGLIVGAGKGVIRSMHCNGNYHAEVVAVDYAINALVAIAHQVGSASKRYKNT